MDLYIRLQVSLREKLSDQTEALTEATSLIDEFYKKIGIQSEEQYRIALDKFHAN